MKRTIFALLIVTLIVAGSAFGVARWLRCRSCATPNTDITRELGLTGTQAAAVAKLDAEFQKKLSALCAAHCAARADLSQSLDDPGKAANCCQRMCDAQVGSEKAALEHIFRVRDLLTPEQQKRHITLVQRQLTGACPMRLHRP